VYEVAANQARNQGGTNQLLPPRNFKNIVEVPISCLVQQQIIILPQFMLVAPLMRKNMAFKMCDSAHSVGEAVTRSSQGKSLTHSEIIGHSTNTGANVTVELATIGCY